MQFNSNFKYDLKRGQEGEQWFAGHLTGDTIECKRDFKTHKTGNVYVEFECRGKPSGIATTEAEYWVFIVGPHENDLRAYLTSTKRLKALYEKAVAENRVAVGGDGNKSLGALVKVAELVA